LIRHSTRRNRTIGWYLGIAVSVSVPFSLAHGQESAPTDSTPSQVVSPRLDNEDPKPVDQITPLATGETSQAFSLPDLRKQDSELTETTTQPGQSWQDVAVPFPVAKGQLLPKLQRMTLVHFRPRRDEKDTSFRVTDDPSSADVLPTLNHPNKNDALADNEATRSWPKTPQLDECLKRLRDYEETTPWADEIDRLLTRLRNETKIGDDAATQLLQELTDRVNEAKDLAEHLEYGWTRTDLTQCYHALLRRMDLWNHLQKLLSSGISLESTPKPRTHLLSQLEAAEAVLRDGGQLLSWSDYLHLTELREVLEAEGSVESLQKAGKEVLVQLSSSNFDADQRQLVERQEFVSLAAAIRPWLGMRFAPGDVLALIEDFELDQHAIDANRLAWTASLYQHLDNPDIARFGERIDQTYRNANNRVEVHQEFMQAFLPERAPDEEPVDDYILGNRVTGRSRKVTQLQIHPVPDEAQWRVQLEVSGDVDSRTSSSSGPVTVFNRGKSRYHAAKQVVVNSQGFWVSQATAKATTTTTVDNLETDFDGIPLIGSLVRNMARGQTDAKLGEAEREVRWKIRRRAERELDEELNISIQKMQDRMAVNLLDPIKELGLEPSVVDLRTTSRGILGRFRAAGASQLAAHTPRPSAPLDSVINGQAHQSTINNMIRQMNLGGRDFTPDAFMREIGNHFPTIRQTEKEELPAKVIFRFDELDPVRVDFSDGMAKITLRMERLQIGDDSWTDLEVAALYSPDSIGWDTTFARSSTVFLKGNRLSFRDQIALRAVFLKVLSQKHRVRLFPQPFAKDPRLKSFEVNQLVLHEGWIAVSLGNRTTTHEGPHTFRVADEAPRTGR